jgi:hypothetical protein
MRFREVSVVLGVVAALVLASSSAHAFTMENRDAGGAYQMPQFDLGEQSRQFRKDGADATLAPGKNNFSTPFGPGTFEFSVRQSDPMTFGSPFSSGPGSWSGSSFGSRATRQDFERMVTPENLR